MRIIVFSFLYYTSALLPSASWSELGSRSSSYFFLMFSFYVFFSGRTELAHLATETLDCWMALLLLFVFVVAVLWLAKQAANSRVTITTHTHTDTHVNSNSLWFRVVAAPRHKVIDNNLNIKEVTLEDGGLYVCRATQSNPMIADFKEMNITLKIQRKYSSRPAVI